MKICLSNCTISRMSHANIAFRYSQKIFNFYKYILFGTILIFINELLAIEIGELPRPIIGAVPTKIFIISRI